MDNQVIILAMIEKSEAMLSKFKEKTSQHTLLINRIEALKIGLALLNNTPLENCDLVKAKVRLESIVSKSSKAQLKLKKESWQYQMLERNIKAIQEVLVCIENVSAIS